MRDFKGMKRQRGRNRGGNAPGGGGNGGKPQHNANRAFDSNGPDGVKIRGNAQHVFEKYQQLARDNASAGDRVLAENYLQHAEHYFRVLRAVQPLRPVSDFLGRETFASGYDIDFEDESNNNFGEPAAPVEADSQSQAEGEGGEQPQRFENRGDQQGYRNNNDQNRDGQNRDQNRDGQNRDQNRGEWQGRDRNQDRNNNYNNNRDQRPRDDQQQQRPRDDQAQQRQDRYRDDRPRNEERPRDGQRDDRPREDRQRSRNTYNDRPPREERDPLAVVEPETTPLVAAAPEPAQHQLRSQDGALSPAPAFLQTQPRAASVEGEAEVKTPRPRRKRARSDDAPAETEEA